MKAILEFNLPEDSNEHEVAVKATDLAAAYDEIDNHLRNEIKYGYDNWKDKSSIEVLESIRNFLRRNAEDFRVRDLVLR